MATTYKDFEREPSKPHQCMHSSEKDGTRCRSTAMHNEYMCYHHRSDDIPTVIQNDPFLIERLDSRDSIQLAITQVAARLACNHMDLKRAALLLQSFQVAASNLTAKERLEEFRKLQTSPLPKPEDDTTSTDVAEPPLKNYDDYTLSERCHLSMTVVLGAEPTSSPRPATLTYEMVQAHLDARRKAGNLPPIKLATRPPVPPAAIPSNEKISTDEISNARIASRVADDGVILNEVNGGILNKADGVILNEVEVDGVILNEVKDHRISPESPENSPAHQPATINQQPATLPTLQASAEHRQPASTTARSARRHRTPACRRRSPAGSSTQSSS